MGMGEGEPVYCMDRAEPIGYLRGRRFVNNLATRPGCEALAQYIHDEDTFTQWVHTTDMSTFQEWLDGEFVPVRPTNSPEQFEQLIQKTLGVAYSPPDTLIQGLFGPALVSKVFRIRPIRIVWWLAIVLLFLAGITSRPEIAIPLFIVLLVLQIGLIVYKHCTWNKEHRCDVCARWYRHRRDPSGLNICSACDNYAGLQRRDQQAKAGFLKNMPYGLSDQTL